MSERKRLALKPYAGQLKSFGTCLICQAVRRRGPELAAEGRSVFMRKGTVYVD